MSLGKGVKCPVCGFEFVHFGKLSWGFKDDYQNWEGKGQATRIPMMCENGHTWELRFGFHKGNTYVDVENIKVENFDIEKMFGDL